MGKAKSLAQQIAALDEPIAKDFDPEEDGPAQRSDEESSSEESDDGLAGTEHYAAVGKSRLRKSDEITLGPEYSGSKVSRQALLNDDDEDDKEIEDRSDSESDVASEDAQEVEEFADPDAIDIDLDDEDRDIDSDNAFGESDMEKFKDFTFRGSSKPRAANGPKKRATAADFMSDSDDEGVPINGNGSSDAETDEDILDIADQHPDDSAEENKDMSMDEDAEDGDDHSENESQDGDEEEESEEESESDSEGEADEKARRAELRKIMGEEQKTVIATISQAAKADAEKGNAVKEQRKAFDFLLSIRMTLQKALVATNSMAAVEEKESDGVANQPYEAAEEAAIKLWNTLDGLRHELSKASSDAKTGQKRKRGAEISTPSTMLWERMQSSEVSVIGNRQTTLDKWSAKVRGTALLPISRKLNPTTAQQSITSFIQDQLANSEHLVKRTKMPRSCAPIQRDLKLIEDLDIYDDGNFYQMLLKELVDQRRVELLTNPVTGGDAGKAMQWTAVKEAKTRKNVDTKASKGRKMRFTVHEKLQNFMAPEDRGSWEPDAIDRFFGTLLGQKMTLGEGDASGDGEGENGVSLEEEGLMLFKS